MKTLILVRHAKSDWDNHELTDFERPLNKRGLKDAPHMGKLIANMKLKPELLISSPAVRALTTAKHFAKELSYPIEKIVHEKSIYEYGANGILRTIQKHGHSYSSIMVFGHNPDLTHLVNFLGSERIDNMPTCGVVCIDFDIDNWDELNQTQGKTRFFEFPKSHKE